MSLCHILSGAMPYTPWPYAIYLVALCHIPRGHMPYTSWPYAIYLIGLCRILPGVTSSIWTAFRLRAAAAATLACACSLRLSLSALVLMRAQCVCSRKRPTSRLYTLKSPRALKAKISTQESRAITPASWLSAPALQFRTKC